MSRFYTKRYWRNKKKKYLFVSCVRGKSKPGKSSLLRTVHLDIVTSSEPMAMTDKETSALDGFSVFRLNRSKENKANWKGSSGRRILGKLQRNFVKN